MNGAPISEESWWAGYRSGWRTNFYPLLDRKEIHAECDKEISAGNYDKPSYDEGFALGSHDADEFVKRTPGEIPFEQVRAEMHKLIDSMRDRFRQVTR